MTVAPTGALGRSTARRLGARRRTAIDPSRATAVKRNVHAFEVGCDADRFAEALEAVLTEPGAVFGLVRVARQAGRVGRPFELGERFQGCFVLERLAARHLPGWLAAATGPLLRSRPARWLEEAALSDHAVVVRVERGEAVRRVEYGYLEGTPLAGRSAYVVTPDGRERCRVESVFEFQELGPLGVTLLHRFGLRAHDEAVAAQIERAARRVGAAVFGASTLSRQAG